MVDHGKQTDASHWDLTALVGALRGARRSQEAWRLDELDRQRARPSREAILRIVAGLRAALFPSYFGGSFSGEGADFYVGNTVGQALSLLDEQVQRALRYASVRSEPSRSAHGLVASFAATLPTIRAALELDVQAAYEGDPAAPSRSQVIFCYPGIYALIHHRIAHELYRLHVPLLPRVISELAHARTGIDIHPGARIGTHFFIDHGTGLVIGASAWIGDRVRVHQGVTLGARTFPRDREGRLLQSPERLLTIEDDVVIHAGATVLGDITVGRGSTIGGKVWLTRTVAPHSQVSQARTREAHDRPTLLGIRPGRD